MNNPARIDPNSVKIRESSGAPDQSHEETFRRESYSIYKLNLTDAFEKFDKSGNSDGYLQYDEFSNFMHDAAYKINQAVDNDTLQ